MGRSKQTVTEHITLLRKTILICLFVTAVGAMVSYVLLRKPLMEYISGHLIQMSIPIIYTSVADAFTTEMKVALIAGSIVTFPVDAVLIWWYVAPAFYPDEKKRILAYSVCSIMLFGMGIVFCYELFFPFVLRFFLQAPSIDITAMLTIDGYVKFLCKIILPFGLLCEMPLVVLFLTSHGIISRKALGKARKYVFLCCIILGAVLTPPDVISQLCVGLPMYVLYESGLLISMIRERTLDRKRREN